MPHYDALVLTLCINGFDVHRVLVDPGSAMDFLQLPTFIQMKLSSNMLNSAGRILSGFNGATIATLGHVTLLVKAEPITQGGFIFSRRGLGTLQCHSSLDLAALHEGYAFNVPPNGKLYNKRWAG